VHVWWELTLYGDIVYSTARGAENWQDHWLETLFPLPTRKVAAGDALRLESVHSDTALWFNVLEDRGHESKRFCLEEDVDADAPMCSCGWHTV
jgi:hypothetical protein